MDVKTFSDQLRNRMSEQIVAVRKEENDELAASAKIIQVIRKGLLELKQFIHQYEFKDREDEIRFFKEIKPGFLSKYFYHDQLLSILIGASFTDLHGKKKYYLKTLKHIQRFQKKNNDFYQYWITNSDHLDDKYFTRKKTTTNDPNLDDKFSTQYDITQARFIANEALKNHLNTKIENRSVKGQEPKLQWTGSKTALIELIYALHTVGVFHHTTSELKHIISSFEHFFSIELGNYSRTYQEIRLRKGSQTNFLDLLRKKLVDRMENW